MLGDQHRIKQILHNLMGNAVKFTSQGGCLTISAHLLERQDSSLLIQFAVRDTGIGITTENLDKIFKPFEQENGSATRSYGGTGLGLTISRHLAELMGGSISVESSPNAGSCFKVTLPLTEVSEGSATEQAPQTATVSWDGPPLQILLVEDDQANITFESSLFKKLGFVVAVAKTGRECLAALENDTFDIVLMDINMPDMNGEEALREIRRIEQDTHLHQKVIALTAYSLRGNKERFLEEGFDGYISKPMAVSELVRELKRVAVVLEKQVAGTNDFTTLCEKAPSGHNVVKGDLNRNNQRQVPHTPPLTKMEALTAIRILLAEDDPSAQKIVPKMLKSCGYQVDVACDGKEALQALEKSDYALVLMDCMMPEMNGYEVTAVIRDPASAVRRHDIPVIALTGNATKKDVDVCIAAGMDDHLPKPLIFEDLMAKLMKWLGTTKT